MSYEKVNIDEYQRLQERLNHTGALCTKYFDDMHMWAAKHREAQKLLREVATLWDMFELDIHPSADYYKIREIFQRVHELAGP